MAPEYVLPLFGDGGVAPEYVGTVVWPRNMEYVAPEYEYPEYPLLYLHSFTFAQEQNILYLMLVLCPEPLFFEIPVLHNMGQGR